MTDETPDNFPIIELSDDENGSINLSWPNGNVPPAIIVSGEFLESTVKHINLCHEALVEIAKICSRLNKEFLETGENPEIININLIESILINIQDNF